MPIASEASDRSKPLATSREPESVRSDSGSAARTVGEQALWDAITVIVVCWVLLFLLTFSLRGHNV